MQLTASPRSLTPSKLILEASYASAETMTQNAAALALPGAFMTTLSINNAERIKQVAQPLPWMYGTDGHYLSLATQGQLVYHHQGRYKEAHRIVGACYNDVLVYHPFRQYLLDVAAFIKQ